MLSLNNDNRSTIRPGVSAWAWLTRSKPLLRRIPGGWGAIFDDGTALRRKSLEKQAKRTLP